MDFKEKLEASRRRAQRALRKHASVIQAGAHVVNTVAGVAKEVSNGKYAMLARGAEGVVNLFSDSTWGDEEDRWDRPMRRIFAFEALLGSVLEREPERVSYRHHADGSTYLYTRVEGICLGVIRYDNRSFEGVYVNEGAELQRARCAYGRLIYEVYGSALEVKFDDFGRPRVTEDVARDFHPTKRGVTIAARIKRYLKAGHSRHLLLHGKPGTGKSNLARHIASELGGMSLRLTARDFNRAEELYALLEILQPTCVIIDDLDHGARIATALDQWGQFEGQTRALIATANHAERLNHALLRAKRFHEIIEVEHLEDDVLEHLLRDVPAELKERAAELPVAYISELTTRIEVEGAARAEVALADLEEMLARVERVAELDLASARDTSPPQPSAAAKKL